MSEWCDNQTKPGSDFHKLLQKRIDKANPNPSRLALTKEEQQKLDKLNGISNTLKRGANVQNRRLQTWLTEDEYEQIACEWDTQKKCR
jgi:hypothetical protein